MTINDRKLSAEEILQMAVPKYRPCQVTTTTDGKTHVAIFDGRHTGAIKHVVIEPEQENP